MPPKAHPRVRLAVAEALYNEYLKAIDEAIDRIAAGDEAAAEWLLGAELRYAEWCVVKNKDHHSYCLARLRLRSGELIERAWRVPYTAPVRGQAGTVSILIRQVDLARYRRTGYPNRARGRAVVADGGRPEQPTRSRPEIGRAYSSRRRKATDNPASRSGS